MEVLTFETSKKSGPHHQLASLAGDWVGTTKTWFEPDNLADESKVKGSITVILDGKFIKHEYIGSFGGKPLEGSCVYGYHLGSGKIQSSWIDSVHTSLEIMFGEGTISDEGFEYTSSYFAGDDQPRWKWRTTVQQSGTTELIIIAFNISPEGIENKAQETVYHRV